MKTLLLTFMTIAMMGLGSKELPAQRPVFGTFQVKAKVFVQIKIARPKWDCRKGFWICFVTIVITGDGSTLSARDAAGEIMLTDKNDKLLIRLHTPAPLTEDGEIAEMFFAGANEAYHLPPDVCEALGLQSAKLIPGAYEIQNSEHGYQDIWLDADIQKVE